MDDEPDYSRYSISDLLALKVRIDRERYPERARRIEEAITQRTQAVIQATPPALPALSLEFRGSAHEYFRVWIVNLCLTLLTCGIFSAWAKVRKKRYLYSHTILDGTPFQYLGQPIPILKGRLVAAGGLLAYYTASHFITSALPYVLAAGLVLAPWLFMRSAAFNARYSAFRNMTFRFDGGYVDALKDLYAWGIIPVAVIGMMITSAAGLAIWGVASAVFALWYPWWIRRIKRFIIEGTSFGGIHGQLAATGGQFFQVYFLAGMIVIAAAIPAFLLAALLVLAQHAAVTLLLTYASYVGGFAYVQARIGNLVWNQTRLGPLRFESILRCRDLLGLYVTNALGIIASAGLLTPWAVIRTLRYRAEHMRVLLDGSLTEFQGSARSAVAAVGAESLDLFDLDVSL